MQFILLFVCSNMLFAQNKVSFQPLRRGDSILAEVITNTNTIYQKGKQTLPVATRIHFSKTYLIQAVSDKGYTLLIRTTKLQDSVNAINKDAFYTSETAATNSSIISKAIKSISDATDTVYTDKYGVIISFNQDTSAFSKDLLNEFAGLKPFYYTIGTVIDFFSSFSIPAFAKGTVWKDYTNIAGEKAVADCNLYHLDDTSAGIKYSETITGKFANTNTNGAEIIARSTGIVKERVLQSRTSAYKLINNALIIVNKSIAIKEKFILRTAE